jgi:TonB family protein
MEFPRPLTACLLLFLLIAGPLSLAQDDKPEDARKIVTKVMPIYPALARPMNLSGAVRLEAVVTPEGFVKSMRLLGGNPVLAESAQSAVREWKWIKSDHETLEIVEIRFHP